MSKKVFLGALAIILILGLGTGAWWMWERGKTPPKVKLTTISPVSIHEEIYANGTITPASQQELRVLSPAKVSRVFVKVGDKVKQGQLLLELDKTLAEAQVSQARANLQVAKATLASSESQLNAFKNSSISNNQIAQKPGNISGNTLNIMMSDTSNSPSPTQGSEGAPFKQAELAVTQAQAMVKQAEEALKVAEAQRSQLTYKSGINGTVLQVNAVEGNLTPVQTPLVVIADVSAMNVEAELNEVDAGRVKVGQKVQITSKVLGDKIVEGIIAQIAPQAVTKQSLQANPAPTVAVSLKLNSVPAELKPGFTVNVQILTSPKEGVLAVPLESLFQEGNKNYVYKYQNGRLFKTEVKVGVATSVLQEITAGLASGDRVVLNPTAQMQDQMAVTPENGSGS
ncbi:MAG: efflux RND transporter periplasmic adaptor subunit [Desulfitobacterium hafniense]|nr:efflux RND transporter periplasmic adaptor subunit [Desulfitobacterium hafniense]